MSVDGIGTPLSAANLAHQMSTPNGIQVPSDKASTEEIKEVAKQLEGVFFSMFVKEMRKTMTEGSLFGEGPGAETYEGFFDQMMGEHLGSTGGLGIADMVMRNAELAKQRITLEELQQKLAAKQGDAELESSASSLVKNDGRETHAIHSEKPELK